MKYLITEAKYEKLIQFFIEMYLSEIKSEFYEYSYDDIENFHRHVEMVNKLVVSEIKHEKDQIVCYVDVYYTGAPYYDFEELIDEINFRIKKDLPNVVLWEGKIYSDSKFGPGIDW